MYENPGAGKPTAFAAAVGFIAEITVNTVPALEKLAKSEGRQVKMRDSMDSGRGKGRGAFWILLLLLAVAGIGAAALTGSFFKKEQEQPETSAEVTKEIIIETETSVEETEAPYVSPINFEELRDRNPDTVGWIRIPDTVIDYPIVHDPEDNEHYLHVDFDGNSSAYGAIYLDCDSKPDFSGWNNPIYGHHMKDGSMFKALERFKEEDFFKDHQYFEIYTPERTIHLKAVACYYSSADGIVRKTQFHSREEFDQWMAKRLEPCAFAEVPEESVDSMFVLVTCSYEMANARTLLFAVEVEERVPVNRNEGEN